MKTNRNVSVSVIAAAWLSLMLADWGQAAATENLQSPTASLRPTSGQRLGAINKGFIPNVGQVPNEGVKFTLRDSGVSAYFTDQGFVLWITAA